jgi:hypothetical protein
MPVLQLILARLCPRVEECQVDHNQEEGSHHGDFHHSEHKEEEREHECSLTPQGGRGHR